MVDIVLAGDQTGWETPVRQLKSLTPPPAHKTPQRVKSDYSSLSETACGACSPMSFSQSREFFGGWRVMDRIGMKERF
jgi:hypothetical protein